MDTSSPKALHAAWTPCNAGAGPRGKAGPGLTPNCLPRGGEPRHLLCDHRQAPAGPYNPIRTRQSSSARLQPTPPSSTHLGLFPDSVVRAEEVAKQEIELLLLRH